MVSLRARIFVIVFAVASLASLGYVFSRPAVYQARASIRIEAPVSSKALRIEVPTTGDGYTESQRRPVGVWDSAAERTAISPDSTRDLTSDQVLGETLRRVNDSNRSLPRINSLEDLRSMVRADPVAGTSVIELSAEAEHRELLVEILASWIKAYQGNYEHSHSVSSTDTIDEMRKALAQLRQNQTSKRQELEQFRKRYDIVSLESEQNQVMAQLKGLNTALNDARTKEVNAEARLNAMRENVASGKSAGREERASIVALEQRASDLRVRMKEMQSDYTPSYLAIDTKYRAMVANLERTEQQMARERQSTAEQALHGAEEELAAARASVSRIQQDLASRRQSAQNFTSRFAEHVALADELKRIEASQAAAAARLSSLETEARGAKPRVAVLSQPTLSERPIRPDYWRDSLLGVGGAGILGLLTIWLVEFLRRSEPRTLPPTYSTMHITYPIGFARDISQPRVVHESVPRLLDQNAPLLRELTAPEVRALWDAASPPARFVIASLFSGISIDELARLRHKDVDLESGQVHFDGDAQGRVLREPLRFLVGQRPPATDNLPLLNDKHGAPLSIGDLEGLVSCAACDAGLSNASEVNSDTLRHTYAAYLVRQGIRLADLDRIIGEVAPAALREYGRLSPAGPGLPMERIEQVYPAFRPIAG